MPHCCVPQCRNRSETSPELSFYRFPAHPEIRRRWMLMIQRDDFSPTPNTRVCSWHFPHGKEKGPSRFHWTENTKEKKSKVTVGEVKKKKSKKGGSSHKSPTKDYNPLDLLATAASVMKALKPVKPMKSIAIQKNYTDDDIRVHDIERDNLHAYAKRGIHRNVHQNVHRVKWKAF